MGSLVLDDRLNCLVDGFPSMVPAASEPVYHSLDPVYAEAQLRENEQKTYEFLEPILRRIGAQVVLDAGCGVGAMVEALRRHGLDAHGFDLLELVPEWVALGRARDRYVVADPIDLALPYGDRSFDCVFSFGVIEHVGTMDGHATRRPDYAEIRRAWLAELFRVVKVGGHLLLGGPNRNFPVDTAHGLDAAASGAEHALSRLARVSVHRPWGPNFLWGYGDLRDYLGSLPYTLTPLSIDRLGSYSRIPWPFGALARGYVQALPAALLGTGFNPWMMALVRRDA